MTPNVITAQEAIAQGSSWAQIVSIARFHSNAIKFMKPKSFDKLPRYKQLAIERAIENTQTTIDAIRSVADAMRRIQEGRGLDG
jgi:hypothetical protein